MESLKEVTLNLNTGKNILTEESVSWKKTLSIPSKGFTLIEISF
jgi:hypothetical protein